MNPRIVGIEMATYDRPSMDWWYVEHLREVLRCVDQLYVRIDNATLDQVDEVVARFIAEEERSATKRAALAARIHLERQFPEYGKFQEDAERQALLSWAFDSGADWAVCLDADEVLEPGGGAALRALLCSPAARTFRLVRVILSYSSHHRPGFVLPRGAFEPWRAFRLDHYSAAYRYVADRDGLHCGSVPNPEIGSVTAEDLVVLHYHATSCVEYMAERAFYEGTSHVAAWGGIDWLYRCDRFGEEAEAIPLAEALAGADARLARIAAGEGLTR